MSHVTCHISRFMCQMSCVTCHMSLREGVQKKPLILWSWSYLSGPPPPFFLELWSPKVIFFCNVSFINWVIQVCLETHFGYVSNKFWLWKALKKTVEYVIMIIPRRNRVEEAISMWSLILKLDGVGSVDNRPSTNNLHHFVRKKKKKNVTCDVWHVTCDTWHVTRDMTRDTWHVTCLGGWTFSQNFSSLALTVCTTGS